MAHVTDITVKMILSRLQQKVSITNAKILMDTARIQTGLVVQNEDQLDVDQAKALCMKLISQGGPAFHVGQSIYKEYLM